MCKHSGPDSDNGHRKKMAKMRTNYPSNNNNNNNCKAAADNNNNNKKYAQWHFTKIYVCARSTLPFSLCLSPSPYSKHSLSPTIVSALFCALLRLLLPDALFALLFTLCRPRLSPPLPSPTHFVVVLTENRDSVKFALSAQWKVTRNSVARARQ